MSDGGVVIGIGNSFRGDDGVGLAVADEIAKRGLADVRVVTAIGEPGAILDAWTGARLATVVDAAMGENAKPGRIRHWTPGDDAESSIVSFTCFWAAADLCAGRSARTATRETVGLTVDIADASLGVGFTPPVAAAVPEVIKAVLEELGRCLCDSAGYPTTSCDSPARTASSLGCLGSARSANRSEDPIPGRQSDVDGQRCLVSMRGSNGIGARACEPQICFWGFSARTWRRPGSPPAVDSVAGAVSGSRQVRREW